MPPAAPGVTLLLVRNMRSPLSHRLERGQGRGESGSELPEEPLLCAADRAGPGLRKIRKRNARSDTLVALSSLLVVFVAADLALVDVHGGSLVLPVLSPPECCEIRWMCREKRVADQRLSGGAEKKGRIVKRQSLYCSPILEEKTRERLVFRKCICPFKPSVN